MPAFESSDELYDWLKVNKPPLIYVSGKTSTGKSTFARKLRDTLDYDVIELEAVLLEVVKRYHLDEQSTFHKVLWETDDSREKRLFFSQTDHLISEHLKLGHRLVLEGAFANGDTLQRVLKPVPKLVFIYFHPTNLDAYLRNLTQRFMQSDHDSLAGLPRSFWSLIDKTEFAEFCETRHVSKGLEHSIKEYAMASMSSSNERLTDFKQRFGGVVVVGVK